MAARQVSVGFSQVAAGCGRAVVRLVGIVTALGLTGCFDLASLDSTAPVQNLVDDWRNEVVYQVMVDRFYDADITNDFNVDLSNQNSYHGGDWQGLIDKLDYFQHLGVTTLWISPVVKNVETDAGNWSYHGYWAQDFTAVNAHFGTLAKLRELVERAHAKKIKVVLDIVTNHVGQLFFYDINKNGQPDILIEGTGSSSTVQRITEFDPDYRAGGIRSFTSLGDAGTAPIIFFNDPAINRLPPVPHSLATPDAFNRSGRIFDYNVSEQVVLGDFPGGLKDLDTTKPFVREAMIEVYDRWARMVDFDGFRIDPVKHVEHEFWQQFCKEIRKRAVARGKKEFVMFGEVFDGDDVKVGSYTRDGELDALVNFPAKFQIFEDLVKLNRYPTQKFQQYWQARADNWAGEAHLDGLKVAPINLPFNFLDNHDTARFLSGTREEVLEQALFLLITMPGVPIIYYGTEQGFSGENDPSNREDMWRSEYNETRSLFVWTKKLLAMRKAHPALRVGSFEFRWVSERVGTGEDVGIIAFSRSQGADRVIAVLNTSDGGTSHTGFGTSDMQTGLDEGTVLVDEIGGEEFTVGTGGTLRLDVKARQQLLLSPK